MISGRHKLIISSRRNDPDAGLFDLEADPGELENLAKKSPDDLKRLQADLARWRASLLPPLEAQPVESVDGKTREQLEKLGYMEKK